MLLTREIVATYRGPGAVVSRLLAQGPREDRALMFVMAACGLFFVAQLPALSRRAWLEGVDLNPLMGGALLAWLPRSSGAGGRATAQGSRCSGACSPPARWCC